MPLSLVALLLEMENRGVYYMPYKNSIIGFVLIAVVLFVAGFMPLIIGGIKKLVYYHKNPNGYF